MKKLFYKRLWGFFDNFFDGLIVVSIAIIAFAGLYALLQYLFWIQSLPFDIDMSQAIKIALNSVVIVKVYETLRMFISHEEMSLMHLIEVGLIGLSVKIFFGDNNFSWQNTLVFAVFFTAYFLLRWWKGKLVKKI